MRFVSSYQDRKKVAAALREIYTAPATRLVATVVPAATGIDKGDEVIVVRIVVRTADPH